MAALGIAPLLGFTDTLVRGLVFGLASLVVAGGMIALGMAGDSRLPPASRMAVLLLVMAAWLTAFEIGCRALAFDAYLAAAAFLPLVVANGALLDYGAPDPARQPAAKLAAGGTLLLVLATVGGVREIAGQGTLGSATLGAAGATGFGLAAVPASGFFLLALLVAAVNALRARRPASGASAP